MSVTGPLQVQKTSPGYWRAIFDNPPVNLFDPSLFAALCVLLNELEKDSDVRIVVFESADPAYFISHLDVEHISAEPETAGAARFPDEWQRFVRRLALAPVVSVAAIRGRARGMGAEFAMACDMRFASRETGVLALPQVGLGVVPGCGGMDLLPHLVGRARSLEIVLSGDDFDSDTAERYGWINRALPEVKLDSFIHALATRIAGFDRRALATAKRMINERSPIPSAGGLLDSFATFIEACNWPEAKARLAVMRAKGWGRNSEVELHYAHHVGRLASELTRHDSHTKGETP